MSSVVTHPIRRMPAGDRRRQIIEAAIEVFGKSGFRGTTTRQLAERAGVSEAIIFRHFATKQDLYAAILAYKEEQTGQEERMEELKVLADRMDDEAVFATVARGVLESFLADPQFHRLMIYAALEGHEFSRMLHSHRWPMHAFLLDYVASRQRAGALLEIDPELIVMALIAMPAHLGMKTGVLGFAKPIPPAEAAAAFCKILMDGIRSPKATKPSPISTLKSVRSSKSRVQV